MHECLHARLFMTILHYCLVVCINADMIDLLLLRIPFKSDFILQTKSHDDFGGRYGQYVDLIVQTCVILTHFILYFIFLSECIISCTASFA